MILRKIFNLKLVVVLLILAIIFLLFKQFNSNDYQENQFSLSIKEPHEFPFVVNEVSTDIDILTNRGFHEYTFRYKNKETVQELKYIVSKPTKEPQDFELPGFLTGDYKKYTIENGRVVYYQEDSETQFLWWSGSDGTLVRLVYSAEQVNNTRLDVEELLNLANQVQ